MNKTDIKNLRPEELRAWFADSGEPTYRVNQVLDWLYKPTLKYDTVSFDSMTNLPTSLRKKLDQNFFIGFLDVAEQFNSADGTVKYLLKTNDGVAFECVAIPSAAECRESLTVCVSTQAGCKMGCKFCATGQQKFYRNLSVGEIYDQVRVVAEILSRPVSNVVFMGQGEPFHNFDNVISALDLINDKRFINVGARKITVSTCGVLKGIEKFSSVNKQYGLAISLHSCVQSTRDLLMPGVAKWPLRDLRRAIERYIEATNRRPTFEYIMLRGVNDDDKHLVALVDFCKGLLCHVNLLTYNNVEGCTYSSSSTKTINDWISSLNASGVTTTHRLSRGSDVAGACGQLINQ